jgi:hypothetical protein
MPKKARRKVAKQQRVAKPAVAVDPVAVSVKAMVRPFDVVKGIASPLQAGKPSQKFMAKANTSISVPSGCYMVFMQQPCIAADTAYASVVVAVQSTSTTPFSGAFKSSTAGDKIVGGGTIQILSSNTPYAAGTINKDGFEWGSVASGLRLTYEGTELNKSGIIRYVHDPELGFNQGNGDWTTKGPLDIISFVDGAPNNIRHSVNLSNVTEINATVPTLNDISEGAYLWSTGLSNTIGGATATTYFALYPGLVGYYLNSSSATVSFHMETIEHWSISGPKIQALHTDSVAHPVLLDQVGNFLQSTRQLHAQQPTQHHVDVMRKAKKAVGSPLGHELLNTALTAALA